MSGATHLSVSYLNEKNRVTSKLRSTDRYTLSHRECGQFRPYVHENFEKFKIVSTPTGSWIRSRLRRDRIQLSVGHRTYLEFFKIFMNIGTELSTLSMGQSIVSSTLGPSCTELGCKFVEWFWTRNDTGNTECVNRIIRFTQTYWLPAAAEFFVF